MSLSDISSLPKLEVQYEDKLYHLIAYFFLNTAWLLAIVPYSSKPFKKNVLISLGIISFGIIVEILQEITTDYRVFDIYDIIANSSGVIISYSTFHFFRKRFLKI
ncbi:VanZ family protein [Psychroflexus lacisalsi]|uniref:VanZ-like domain-containing protein n=1 Tax=Psychroflexus lacisalsi TaxID=503928 RepID=A0ABN1K0F1_9FLAO|nr:VanZ family protein [Psychroflexus lacisalsi]MBZ9620932.1 VanZ family protein [Psychroflexus lacisalsi]